MAVAVSVVVAAMRFLVTWGLVWGIQVLFEPRWLVGDKGDLDAVLTVVPPTIVTVFVLVLGSLFVVAQQAANAHGTRAPLMLIYDPRARSLVVGPLLVAGGALALTGFVYERQQPPDWELAAATTLVLATAGVLVSSAARLFSLLLMYTAPVNFAKVVLRDVDFFLEGGATGMVVFRVGLLGEMGRTSLRRGDAPGLQAALGGLRRMADLYLATGARVPQVREHSYDSTVVTGWMATELRTALVSMGTEAIAAGAPEEEPQGIAELLGDFGAQAVRAGWPEEYREVLRGMEELGTCVQQATPSGAVNLYAPAAFGLARLEQAAEGRGDTELAAEALAGWLLVVSYWAVHFNINEQTTLQRGIYDLGFDPPWHRAHELLVEDSFEDRWLNKMPNGPMALVGTLAQAQQIHAEIHGRAPTPSPDEDLAALEGLVNQNRPGRLHRLWAMLAAGLPDQES